MTTNIVRATRVLYDEGVGSRDTRYHLIHALADEGLIALDLPAPSRSESDGYALWKLDHIDISAETEIGKVYVDGNELTPEQAHAEANALLAAVAHATREKK